MFGKNGRDLVGLVAHPGVLVGSGQVVDVLYQFTIVIAAGHIHAIGVTLNPDACINVGVGGNILFGLRLGLESGHYQIVSP